jgi:hypothetical protein
MEETAPATDGPDERPLLIAADWQSRALLLAELEERGIEVRTEAGIYWATRVLMEERLAPPLVLLDTSGDPDATPHKVEQLLKILADDKVYPTLVFLVSVYQRNEWHARFGPRAIVLARPKTVDEIATYIRARLREK